MTTDKITDEQIEEAGHDASTDGEIVRALCAYLDCEPGDLDRESYDHYGLALYSQGSREYAIGTDSECDKAAAEYIKDSAWAFNSSFLASFTDLPEEVFTALQPQCESSNDAVLALIERGDGGLESFVEDAIGADGRGHFMSSYDGEENEEGEFYIYRIN
jgi:hypothetical protein